jgi:hypothetical protein
MVNKRKERIGIPRSADRFLGEIGRDAGEHFTKGSNVYVEGNLKTENKEHRDGKRATRFQEALLRLLK